MKALLGILALLLLTDSTSFAAQKNRQKVIDFEDEVVEGVNQRPLDSLSQISEAKKRKNGPHLYRKRGGFRAETLLTLKNLKFTP